MQWYSRAGLILCFILALVLHLALSLLFLHTLHHHQTVAGSPYAKLIHTYLYPLDVVDRHLRGSNTKLIHMLHKQEQNLPQTHALSVLPDHTGKMIEQNVDHQVSINRLQKNSIKGSGRLEQQGDSTLLVLLHNQIQAHNQYPEQAIQLKQTGTVTLRFYLKPTGEINQIRLVKSSGITSLDQAAIHAVARSSPLNLGKNPLKSPRFFTIQLHYN